MAATPGATVKIGPYDLGEHEGPGPEAGDLLVTYSEKTERHGTVYRILASRLMVGSAKPGRYDLRCQVLGKFDDLQGQSMGSGPVRFFTIVWYPRERKRLR